MIVHFNMIVLSDHLQDAILNVQSKGPTLTKMKCNAWLNVAVWIIAIIITSWDKKLNPAMHVKNGTELLSYTVFCSM